MLLAAALLFASTVLADEGVPGEMLQRTIFINTGSNRGTGFLIDYKGKIYIVTARHVVTGLPANNAKIQVRQAGEWKEYQTVRTLFPTSKDVDIAILETNEKIAQPFLVRPAGDDDGVVLGQQVFFLGYPYGIGSKFSKSNVNFADVPFIKRGAASAIDAIDPNKVILYIDGFNNPGFSGGPIIFWNFKDHQCRILGVVQGFRNDTAKVLVNGEQVDSPILVNSGILIGYSIKHALQAMEDGSK